MALIGLKEILSKAREEKYAVGCFNVVNMETVRACIESAEELSSPIIIAIAEVHLPFIDMDLLIPFMKECAEKASVSVCILVDHGYNKKLIKKMIDLGMSSIMYDISALPFEEHVKRMKSMVEYCESMGVDVEGELGYVGREEGGWDAIAEIDIKVKYSKDSRETTPAEAKEYIRCTGVNALAVSIGNVHGQRTESANLNFELLDEINRESTVPLVLHGSSGISNEDLKKAVEHGITKVNYYTGLSNAATNAIRKKLSSDLEWGDYHPLIGIAIEAMKKIIREKITVLGSVNKS